MDPEQYLYPALFVVAMFVAATNAKALGVVIAFCIGLAVSYPAPEGALFLLAFLVPAVLLAGFRD